MLRWIAFITALIACSAARCETPSPEVDPPTAVVELDGRALFSVRGVSAYPAEVRSEAIAKRVAALAADPAFDPEHLQTVEGEQFTEIRAKGRVVVILSDADAAVEAIDRQQLARAYQLRIGMAIEDYRRERSPAYLQRAALITAAATAGFILATLLLLWASRRVIARLERKFAQHARDLNIQSLEIVRAQRLTSAVHGAFRALRWVGVAVLVYAYLQITLSLFPWTRPAAERILGYVMEPLRTAAHGFAQAVPDLIVLAVFILIARYVLRLLKMLFDAIGRGAVKLQNFDPDWAGPTYRIVRVVVLVFLAVCAYPYVPGSSSEAFKGISVFLGLMLSIGSSSFIANVIAGYAVTYRRLFREGDFIKIDDTLGEVVHKRLQVTHLRSLKNEEVTVPNSLILNSKVVNYSSMARERGLILHTMVGIGYETPWRQVEAMLLMAAERTPGLLRDPKPFVLHRSLGDYAVNYELNVYCTVPARVQELYTDLHRNVLDVFNEYGVQIMTPSYMADPAEPKIVSKENWFMNPAKPAESATPARTPSVEQAVSG